VISDFVRGEDRIDLSSIDPVTGGLPSNVRFDFVGTGAFTESGQVRAVQFGVATLLQLNTEGTLAPEASILLSGITAATLTAADLVL
jgi:hypothetical protein